MELRLNGTIKEGRLVVDILSGTPAGEVEVTVRTTEPRDVEARNRQLFAWLDERDKGIARRSRTRAEADADIEAERDSWD